MVTPNWGPKCPNHGCLLEDVGFPIPCKGRGICPVSKCSFEFEIELDQNQNQVAKDKNGNVAMTTGWKISEDDYD